MGKKNIKTPREPVGVWGEENGGLEEKINLGKQEEKRFLMISVHRYLPSVGNAPGPILNPEEMGIKKTVTVCSHGAWKIMREPDIEQVNIRT